MHQFSAVEMAVTEALLALHEATNGGASVRLRQLIGQRLEDLTAAVGSGGPFGVAGKAVHTELTQYREKHEHFRNLLCHAFVRVSVERNGHWLLVLRAVAISAGKADRSTLVLDQTEAQARLENLKRDRAKLAQVLGQLRKSVAC